MDKLRNKRPNKVRHKEMIDTQTELTWPPPQMAILRFEKRQVPLEVLISRQRKGLSVPDPGSSSQNHSAYDLLSMIHKRTERNDEVLKREIKVSKVHWSELISGCESDDNRESNQETFESLRKIQFYQKWLGISEDVDFSDDLVIGRKLAEGGQAEIFEVEDCRTKATDRRYVLKVFKKGYALQDLQSQWPDGCLHFIHSKTIVRGGMVLQDDRFAFLLKRRDIDLRKLIDIAQERNSPLWKRDRRPLREFATYEPKPPHQGCSKPIFNDRFVQCIMCRLAYGMYLLHDIDVLHRDLKASNILCTDEGSDPHCLKTLSEEDRKRKELSYGASGRFITIDIADFESSVGVNGTAFWRAPEILQQLKDEKARIHFTREADVYSYAMTFYELLTGRIPFKEHKTLDYDHVLGGGRPTLPDHVPSWMRDLIQECWHQDPSKRPTFYRIWQEIRSHEISVIRSIGWIRSSLDFDPDAFPVILEGPDEVPNLVTKAIAKFSWNNLPWNDPEALEKHLLIVTGGALMRSLVVVSTAKLCKYFLPETPFWKLLCTMILLSDSMSYVYKRYFESP